MLYMFYCSLSDNNVGNHGAAAFARVLGQHNNNSLITLNLTNANIGECLCVFGVLYFTSAIIVNNIRHSHTHTNTHRPFIVYYM
jgi:hypothetical protein